MTLDDQVHRAETILDEAIREFAPVAIFAGFSGGYDSIVSTHFTLSRIRHAAALHLNTGIGIERTREFVRATASDFDWEYHEERTLVSYEDIVLGKLRTKDGTKQPYPGGFPGPPMHGFMYQQLKERPLEKIASRAREASGIRRRRNRKRWVMIVTGVRSDESQIRTGYKRAVTVQANKSRVWVNPLYWATADNFRAYRATHDLPANPVKEALGFSGECLCGAHADKGELLRIRMACPATADYLEDLQRRVVVAGFPWGYEERPPQWYLDEKRGQRTFYDCFDATCEPGPLCHSCEKFSAGCPDDGTTRPVLFTV